MFPVSGKCQCGSISIQADLTQELLSYGPRSCDCDFCLKYGVSYLSDPKGKLVFQIKDGSLEKQKQGSETADFLICKSCQVLVGVMYEVNNQTFAAINSETLLEKSQLSDKVVVSPKKLSVNEKTKRWKEVWFSDVAFNYFKRSKMAEKSG